MLIPKHSLNTLGQTRPCGLEESLFPTFYIPCSPQLLSEETFLKVTINYLSSAHNALMNLFDVCSWKEKRALNISLTDMTHLGHTAVAKSNIFSLNM